MFTHMLKSSIAAVLMTLLLSMPASAGEMMPANFGSAEWAADNWHDAVRYLQHLTDEKMRNRLLAVPDKPELKREAWKEFWIKYDPVESTPENEYRMEYFNRIRHAQKEFSTEYNHAGWLTDRGETYVELGEPESVEKIDLKSTPADLIVWDYRDKHDTTLFFMKMDETGQVVLVNPKEMHESEEDVFRAKMYR